MDLNQVEYASTTRIYPGRVIAAPRYATHVTGANDGDPRDGHAPQCGLKEAGHAGVGQGKRRDNKGVAGRVAECCRFNCIAATSTATTAACTARDE